MARWGWTGVNVFFVISGYPICMSNWGRELGAFFASRVARLFPLRGRPTLAQLAVNLTIAVPPTVCRRSTARSICCPPTSAGG